MSPDRLLRLLVGASLASAALGSGCASLPADRAGSPPQVVATFCPGSCPEKVARLLEGAERTIDLTVYGIRNDIVAEALIRAVQRDVDVTVIYDRSMYRANQRAKNSKIDPLREAGVRVLPFRGRDAFHHKTIILDADRVWTGSLNLKWMGRLHDNYLLISDPFIVARYREWFGLLEQNPTREALRSSNQRLSQYNAGEPLQAHFGPSASFSEPLTRLMDEAESSLELAVNVLSYPPVVASLVAARQRGVRVRVLFGVFSEKTLKSYDQQEWAMRTLAAQGVEVWTIGLHHQKMMVVDGTTVLTGSPGFDTNPLTRNHDNYVIVESRELASQFEDRMAEMWAEAQRYSAGGAKAVEP